MPSFGEELKRERELRSISLREVAEATKVNIRYLEAIERNDFEHLPGGVFNRGFVRAYAQYIGVDPEAMVNAYLLEEQGQGGRSRGSSDAKLLRGRRSAPPAPRPEGQRVVEQRANRPLLRWGLLGLLLAALVIAVAVLWVIASDATAAAPPGRPAAQTGDVR